MPLQHRACSFTDLTLMQCCLHAKWVLVVKVHNGCIVDVQQVLLAQYKVLKLITCSMSAVWRCIQAVDLAPRCIIVSILHEDLSMMKGWGGEVKRCKRFLELQVNKANTSQATLENEIATLHAQQQHLSTELAKAEKKVKQLTGQRADQHQQLVSLRGLRHMVWHLPTAYSADMTSARRVWLSFAQCSLDELSALCWSPKCIPICAIVLGVHISCV